MVRGLQANLRVRKHCSGLRMDLVMDVGRGCSEKKASSDRFPDLASSRQTTQTVAFRVIAVIEDALTGPTPVWGPCPLTAEEENILRGLGATGGIKDEY